MLQERKQRSACLILYFSLSLPKYLYTLHVLRLCQRCQSWDIHAEKKVGLRVWCGCECVSESVSPYPIQSPSKSLKFDLQFQAFAQKFLPYSAVPLTVQPRGLLSSALTRLCHQASREIDCLAPACTRCGNTRPRWSHSGPFNATGTRDHAVWILA